MQILLWTGQKHSGKSTAAGELVECLQHAGFSCAGLLAPSRYENGKLCGFDALDVATGIRERLLNRVENGQETHVGNFAFCDAGLQLAEDALTKPLDGGVDFVVVDEFGPLELSGSGWRRKIDELAELDGVLMLVVREELTQPVAEIYSPQADDVLTATDADSIVHTMKICSELKKRRQL